jgi:3-deoxy-7-phosphoheptulonate synthase
VAAQIAAGDTRIKGVMIESHLEEGRQDISDDQDMLFGQSITDACISWDDSAPLLRDLAASVRTRRNT